MKLVGSIECIIVIFRILSSFLLQCFEKANYRECHKKPESISTYKNIDVPFAKSGWLAKNIWVWVHLLAHGAFSSLKTDKRIGNFY